MKLWQHAVKNMPVFSKIFHIFLHSSAKAAFQFLTHWASILSFMASSKHYIDSEITGMLGNNIVSDLNELGFRLKLRFDCMPDNINDIDGELDKLVWIAEGINANKRPNSPRIGCISCVIEDTGAKCTACTMAICEHVIASSMTLHRLSVGLPSLNARFLSVSLKDLADDDKQVLNSGECN